MKKTIIISLMAFAGTTMLAQESNGVRMRAVGPVFVQETPKVAIDKKTGLTTITWSGSENLKDEDMVLLDHVPTASDMDKLYSDDAFAKLPEQDFTPMCWSLSDEGTSTVLHCYLPMKANIVRGLWIGGDETGILDKESGAIYKAIRTVPAECYNRTFSVKGKAGSFLDLQIVFPLIHAKTRDLAIYGVPKWMLRGMEIKNFSRDDDDISSQPYDAFPDFHLAYMVSDSVGYDKDNWDTWAVYRDPHFIKPIEENTMALWRTPDATYLAIATEQNWIREYYGRGGDTMLLDSRGHRYKCLDVLGYPNDKLFWIEGHPGDYFAIVLKFEPLPVEVNSITYIVPEGEPFNAWGANWAGEVIPDLNVAQLRRNQPLFDYHQRVIVRQSTNLSYDTDKWYTIRNKQTGARLGVSFDYNNHASAFIATSPKGRGPNGIEINENKTFRFRFLPCSPYRDCLIVTEDGFALADESESGEGQWLVFRYCYTSDRCQQWTLHEHDGEVYIINKATGRCVDLAGGETKEGAAVFSYDINHDPQTNDNQKWIIEEAE